MADRLVALVVVCACVIGLGLAAASLSAAPTDQSGSGTGNGSGVAGGGPTPGSNQSGAGSVSANGVVPSGAVALFFLASVAFIVPAVLYYRGDLLKGVVVGIVILGAILAFAVVAPDISFPGSNDPGAGANVSTPVDNDSSPDGGGSESSGPPVALLGAVGLALALAAAAVAYATRSVDDSTDFDTSGETDSEPIADAAARAADAIVESQGPERWNAVYEAWDEMAAAVDVSDPATATPGEFADAAVATGADPDAVADLTAVFEAVRYGAEPPDEYEDRAVDALRRIEASVEGSTDSDPGVGVAGADNGGEQQ